MAISAQSFPGVYTSITDQSAFTSLTSRFKAGLIGVAEKGPFDVPVNTRSIGDFISVFGKSLTGTSYLADTVAIISAITDGTTIVRVGRQYESTAAGNGSGTSGSYDIVTPDANLFSVNDFIRITQNGLPSTVNARVEAVNPTSLTLVSVGSEALALAASYSAANIDKSPVSGAANEAEGFLQGYTYGSVISAAGNVVGDKNAFQFTVSGDQTTLNVGDLIRIDQTDRVSTREVRIKEVRADKVIKIEPANLSEIGYQALPLQDSYTAGQISKVTGTVEVLHMLASTAGTWANRSGTNGLVVKVSPGSNPDTKKLVIFSDSALVETIDNLSDDPDSDDFYTTRINGNSSFINVNVAVSPFVAPANTLDPWNRFISTPLNIATFSGGFNGEAASTQDFIGTINPADDSATGLKVFEDTDNVDVNVLCAPGNVDIAVAQEIARIARAINAEGLLDVPQGLNSREAVDWHNGTGLYSNRGKLDTYNLSVFWNWITIIDPFTGLERAVPPTVGALRAMAFTFDREKPWFAAAGETRGLIPEAIKVEFERLSLDSKSAMYGNGNSVNPILLNRGRIMVFGDRTLQRTESKLTAIHSVHLVNHIVNNMAIIGRQFVFDPNDSELIAQLSIRFTEFLNSVQAERGIEQYRLVMDSTNNTAATRNAREVHVSLFVIPTDTMERLFIDAIVKASGAQLTNNP